jgi:valyl-tRNA synthetase
MQTALSAMLRLLAPYLPFVTEEVWSWWHADSVHRTAWPTGAEVLAVMDGAADENGERALDLATEVLGEIRRSKSEQQRPLRTPVARLILHLPEDDRKLGEAVRADITAAGFVRQFDIDAGPERRTIVELAVEQPAEGPRA